MISKIKLSDYIVSYLEHIGVHDVFMISGGGVMHIVDSVGRAKKLRYYCNHHEQACAIAAEAYGRLRDLGVCIVTTGPGGTNTITGILGAWLDSVPMLCISGQVNVNATVGSTGLPLRQLGDQEVNIVEMVKSITKYAAMITKPEEIKYHLEKAVHLATSGRPGPVWLDIPLDVQGAYMHPRKVKTFSPSEVSFPHDTDGKKLKRLVSEVIRRIEKSTRPVLFAGNGIRFAKAQNKFLQMLNLLKIPVLSSFAGYDLIDSRHPYFMGRPGTVGQRAANFILQNSDLLLSVGSRLNTRIVTYNPKTFARVAFKIIVDIDTAELKKQTIHPDIAVNYDAKDFIEEMIVQLEKKPLKNNFNAWLMRAREWNETYPVVLPEYWEEKNYANSFCFIDALSDCLKPRDVVVLADGTACTCTYQALRVKRGQRVIVNSGCAAMGYGFPASIGACIANNKKRVVCIDGDGSLQLNIQELQTMKIHNLPVKLFVYSNDGYLSIKNTQDIYFEGRHVASDRKSGVSCPDIVKIAKAYGLKTERIRHNKELRKKIQSVLQYPGPIVCDIRMAPNQTLYPKVRGEKLPDGTLRSKPLEDMYPFLPREEFLGNMIIPPWEP